MLKYIDVVIDLKKKFIVSSQDITLYQLKKISATETTKSRAKCSWSIRVCNQRNGK